MAELRKGRLNGEEIEIYSNDEIEVSDNCILANLIKALHFFVSNEVGKEG